MEGCVHPPFRKRLHWESWCFPLAAGNLHLPAEFKLEIHLFLENCNHINTETMETGG